VRYCTIKSLLTQGLGILSLGRRDPVFFHLSLSSFRPSLPVTNDFLLLLQILGTPRHRATIDPWSPAYLRRQTGLGLCLDVMLWSARSGKMARWVDLRHLTRNQVWFGIRHRAHARLSPQKFCRRCFLQMAVDCGCSPENGKLDGFSLECTSNSI